MQLKKVHPYIEIKRPIRLRRYCACIHPQIIIALIKHAEITLCLARYVFHWAIGQGGFIQKGERVINA